MFIHKFNMLTPPKGAISTVKSKALARAAEGSARSLTLPPVPWSFAQAAITKGSFTETQITSLIP